MEFDAWAFGQDKSEEEEFTVIDHMLGDLAMGEHVRIFARGLMSEEDRSLIEDLREAGAEVIIPSDN